MSEFTLQEGEIEAYDHLTKGDPATEKLMQKWYDDEILEWKDCKKQIDAIWNTITVRITS
jgi:hypothetical protein|tara:strand:- start:421 stop:600 length:180 start_codon:yes stop_codon:yes gene_type:complete